MEQLFSELKEIKTLIQEQCFFTKDHLTFKEACQYLDLSESYLYKLTASSAIPYYVPTGKKIYFKLSDLKNWVLQNRHSSVSELENKATQFVFTQKRNRDGK